MDRKVIPANELQVTGITKLVQRTIKEIYIKYYRDEVVSFFINWHDITRISEDVAAGKECRYINISCRR